MELINWSLNATDTIFSTRKSGPGEPACPDGTHPAGYVLDAWGKWRVACLAPLSVEDVEDLYLFGFMVGGLLLLGLGAALSYRKIGKTTATKIGNPHLPVMINEVGKAIQSQTALILELKRKMETISEELSALRRNRC